MICTSPHFVDLFDLLFLFLLRWSTLYQNAMF